MIWSACWVVTAMLQSTVLHVLWRRAREKAEGRVVGARGKWGVYPVPGKFFSIPRTAWEPSLPPLPRHSGGIKGIFLSKRGQNAGPSVWGRPADSWLEKAKEIRLRIECKYCVGGTVFRYNPFSVKWKIGERRQDILKYPWANLSFGVCPRSYTGNVA